MTRPRPLVALYWDRLANCALVACVFLRKELSPRQAEAIVMRALTRLFTDPATWKIEEKEELVAAFALIVCELASQQRVVDDAEAAGKLARLRRSLKAYGDRDRMAVLDAIAMHGHCTLDELERSGLDAETARAGLAHIRARYDAADGHSVTPVAAGVKPSLQLRRVERALFLAHFDRVLFSDEAIARAVASYNIPNTGWRFLAHVDALILDHGKAPGRRATALPDDVTITAPVAEQPTEARGKRTRARAEVRGTVVGGRYELICELGRGGEKSVWRAKDLETGEHCAVGLMYPELCADENFRRACARSLSAWTGLALHDRVVRARGWGWVDDEQLYIVTELLDATAFDLLQFQRAAGAKGLPLGTSVHVVAAILDALTHLHELGLVSRDVTADNFFLTRDGRVLLGDLSMMKPAERSRVTPTHLVKGKPSYLAPEQLAGQVSASPGSDQFCAARALYVLCGGALPKQDGHGAAPLPPLRSVNPNVSPELEAVIARAMAADPAARFPSATAMNQALAATPEAKQPHLLPELVEAMLDGRPRPVESVKGSAILDIQDKNEKKAPRRAWKWIAAAAAVCVVAIGAAGAAWLYRAGARSTMTARPVDGTKETARANENAPRAPQPQPQPAPIVTPAPVVKPAPIVTPNPAPSAPPTPAQEFAPLNSAPNAKKFFASMEPSQHRRKPAPTEVAPAPVPVGPEYATLTDPNWISINVAEQSEELRVNMGDAIALDAFVELIDRSQHLATQTHALPPRAITCQFMRATDELFENGARRARFTEANDLNVRNAFHRIEQSNLKGKLEQLLKPNDRCAL